MTAVGSLRVTANPETCVTSSLCVYRLPQVFDQDAEGRVRVLDERPPDELRRELLRARRGCPTRSIHVEGPGTGADDDPGA
ncbi:ferredoxin [Streptomyces sp. NPDC049577]|uniref:ferredoxin n=1 Tax=Streptomyces sp. NPDC049577 TaxID=3155153 RepID=UPI0034470B9C